MFSRVSKLSIPSSPCRWMRVAVTSASPIPSGTMTMMFRALPSPAPSARAVKAHADARTIAETAASRLG
jgi:hypothetical protein